MTPEDYERELARKDNELEAIKALLMTQAVPDEVKRLQNDLIIVRGDLADEQSKVASLLDEAATKEEDRKELSQTLSTTQKELEEALQHGETLDEIEEVVEDLCVSFGLPRRPSPVDLCRWPALKRLVDLVQL